MNKVVEEQLKKVKVAQLPPYDETTLRMTIPKVNSIINSDLNEGQCYLIQVEDYIVKPFDGFSLHDNWNKGIVPTDMLMNIQVLQVMGKMVKVEGVGVDINLGVTLPCSWVGWLPVGNVKIMEEI